MKYSQEGRITAEGIYGYCNYYKAQFSMNYIAEKDNGAKIACIGARCFYQYAAPNGAMHRLKNSSEHKGGAVGAKYW